VTPAHRGRGAAKPPVSGADPAKPSPPRHVAMSWARRLKRVFGVQIESCARCGGELKIIASIEEPQLIAKMIEQVSLSKRRRACSRAQEHPLAWRHEFSRHSISHQLPNENVNTSPQDARLVKEVGADE
jgi:hypothetical protein